MQDSIVQVRGLKNPAYVKYNGCIGKVECMRVTVSQCVRVCVRACVCARLCVVCVMSVLVRACV